ncbi:MAG TPA: SDR family NAD(P)-dependent oxidoreductase [Dinghuibacter sp.]|uniref:SDR family NAD(P)-dependent oxidoreductase n=1 Tax=Dinghuibacter sp. TaxID=2024697 RepID=UPI002BA72C49|nr:SDR family NAD(P)-dependent oxidoreductase [Dinghuibacter sp.]HTJ13536.1 SDR family NAD(P)-dependent oxidoreductase [Dinghuibacter sp.]
MSGAPGRPLNGRVFITGSADGLGLAAARMLVALGHEVVVHGRSPSRAREALEAARGAGGAHTAVGAVYGDLSSVAEAIDVARQANELGPFSAVIHNAGVYLVSGRGAGAIPMVFAVNTLAPYILTCLIDTPSRLIYTSSGLHRGGDASVSDLLWEQRRWNASSAYADSKLHDVLLAYAVARRWPSIYSNAVDPGWVATRMGGRGAPGTPEEGSRTQVWLSSSPEALVSGRYFYRMHEAQAHPAARDVETQERLLAECARLSGINFPGSRM